MLTTEKKMDRKKEVVLHKFMKSKTILCPTSLLETRGSVQKAPALHLGRLNSFRRSCALSFVSSARKTVNPSSVPVWH